MVSSFYSKVLAAVFFIFCITSDILYAQPPMSNVGSIEIWEVKNLPQLQNILSNNEMVVFLYSAPEWCPACKKMKNDGTFPKLKDYNKETNIVFVQAESTKANAMDDIKDFFNISGVPTVIFIKNGKKVSLVSGARAVSDYQVEIDKLKKKSVKRDKVQTTVTKPVVKPVVVETPAPQTYAPPVTMARGGKVIELSSASEFEQLKKQSTYKVLDFYTTWCGPCKQLKLVLPNIAASYDATFISINAERFPSVAAPYNISSYPTIIILGPQNNVADTIRGFGGEPLLKRQLEKTLGGSTGRVVIKEECIRMR